MPKFLICFRVEQVLQGAIVVEAPDAQAARLNFQEGDYDDQRLDAKLDLDDSHDTIVELRRYVCECAALPCICSVGGVKP